jgi:hypothetical protein
VADGEKTAKTETLGYIPANAVKSFKGWDKYEKAAKDLTAAREAATAAKKGIREQLAKFGDGVDFVIDPDGRMRIFRDLRRPKERGSRGRDLSAELFR